MISLKYYEYIDLHCDMYAYIAVKLNVTCELYAVHLNVTEFAKTDHVHLDFKGVA